MNLTKHKPPPDNRQVAEYVVSYFRRADRTAWPTVRQVARGLHWKQERVLEAVEGDADCKLQLTSYGNTPTLNAGDHFVEVF